MYLTEELRIKAFNEFCENEKSCKRCTIDCGKFYNSYKECYMYWMSLIQQD